MTSNADLIQDANAALLVDGDLDAVACFFTEDYVAHATRGDTNAGHDGVRRFLRTLRKAFADLSVEVEVLAVDGERVAWQRTVRGTHVGAFQGFPATDRPLAWRDMLVSRFEDGRIAEEWAVSDLAEQLLRARKG